MHHTFFKKKKKPLVIKMDLVINQTRGDWQHRNC